MKPINTSLPISGFWDSRQGGRSENQDQCAVIDTPLGFLALVCDGMGGGPSGSLASDTAVRKIYEFLKTLHEGMSRKEALKEAIEYAHEAIVSLGNDNPVLKGMGTTVAAVLINEHSAIVAHVGDSRVYQFRYGRKLFRTADHSMVADMVRNGVLTEEQARLSSQSNIITKALGGQLRDLAEVCERPYEKGDRFLLCSDGIWGMVPEKELIRSTAKQSPLSKAVNNTIDTIDAIGIDSGNTHDNLTIVMLEMKKDSKLKEKMSKKIIRIMVIMAAICLLSIIGNIILFKKLAAPNDVEQKVKALTEELSARDRQIEDLQIEINKLNTDVAKSKQAAADAKLEAAEEKTKAAEKAKAEAEQQAKEAKAAAERANVSAQEAKKAANEILQLRKDVTFGLTKARDNKKGNTRKNTITNVVNSLNTLCKKDPKNRTIYQDIKEKLGSNVTYSNSDKATGHFNILIKKITDIK